MKTYSVLVTRDTTESVELRIPGESAEEVRELLAGAVLEELVERYALKKHGLPDWQADDTSGDPYLGDSSSPDELDAIGADGAAPEAHWRPVGLNLRETATVLAGLRSFQELDEEARASFDHFDEQCAPLSDDEINALCERIAFGAPTR